MPALTELTLKDDIGNTKRFPDRLLQKESVLSSSEGNRGTMLTLEVGVQAFRALLPPTLTERTEAKMIHSTKLNQSLRKAMTI